MLVGVIAIIGYLDSPHYTEREQVISTLPVPEEEESASATVTEKDELQEIFELENRLVDLKQEDGYSVEVYREYEIYKDMQGNVIDRVPTENYHYLRYKE